MRSYGRFGRALFPPGVALVIWTATLASEPGRMGVPLEMYTNFEGAQTHPVALGPSGTRLFAVNTGDARLSVFDLTRPASPTLLAEIPVGIEPVSVRARTDDEVWVVNQISNSVSIVSVSRGIVIDTLQAKSEPADVAFVGGRAFVTVSRSNAVQVFDTTTHARVATIPLQGDHPRAIAADPEGRKVYALFALSGNRTTIIPAEIAPLPPSPTNPRLPPLRNRGSSSMLPTRPGKVACGIRWSTTM